MINTDGLEYELDELERILNQDAPLTAVFEQMDTVLLEYDATELECDDTGDLQFYMSAFETCINDDMDREQVRVTLLEKIADIRDEIKRLKGV